jgi:3-hydroxyisobutyrate dehydrogenase-like beta-hydroxyacid dehydrogenase
MNIGWVGLGSIGTLMVKRLLAAGQPVTVYPRGAGLSEVRGLGAQECPDYAALAAKSDLLVLCVYDDAQLRNVLFDQGALKAMRPGSILAIHTTGSPGVARETGDKAPPGVEVLDATFSGGPGEAAEGTLTLMVGGAAEALDRARSAFKAYTKQIYHVGPLGHGQVLKLLNNLLFATNLMNAVELLGLAERYGFDTQTVAHVLQGCSGASFAMRLFQAKPVPTMLNASRPYLEKDVATAVAVAREAGVDISFFTATADYFETRKA